MCQQIRSIKIVALVAAISFCAQPAFSENTSIRGQVVWDDDPLRPRKVRMDRECLELRDGQPPKRETVVINANGTVKNVLLYIENPPSGQFPVPKDPVNVRIKGCWPDQHVIAVRTGQTVTVRYDDPILHDFEVRRPPGCIAAKRPLPTRRPSDDFKFKEQRTEVQLKCVIHPWERTWCHAFDHPFFAVSDDLGMFEIVNLPPGKHWLRIWHEEYGERRFLVRTSAVTATPLTLYLSRDGWTDPKYHPPIRTDAQFAREQVTE